MLKREVIYGFTYNFLVLPRKKLKGSNDFSLHFLFSVSILSPYRPISIYIIYIHTYIYKYCFCGNAVVVHTILHMTEFTDIPTMAVLMIFEDLLPPPKKKNWSLKICNENDWYLFHPLEIWNPSTNFVTYVINLW